MFDIIQIFHKATTNSKSKTNEKIFQYYNNNNNNNMNICEEEKKKKMIDF